MPKNEPGEFELVLGNKQLLSVFFIVVILLAVFFTMGYIVGRNSAPPLLEASNRRGIEGRNPPIVDSPNAPAPSQIPSATETKPAAEEPKRIEPRKPEPKVEEKPKAEVKPKVEEKEKEKPKEKEKKPAAEVTAGDTGASPKGGSQYLQVRALPTDQASLVLEVLRKKGFATATEPVPNKGLTRILVGPIELGAAPDVRDRLDQAGFQGKQAILRKF